MPRKLRIAAVSYLNSKPLIAGLGDDEDVELILDVPAKLLELMQVNRADVALLPVIDYQRMANLRIIPAGGIASEDQTLTVRIFSDRPIREITSLGCDPDSHTSVALARIILAERYQITPTFTALRDSRSVLLIGDKVICDQPRDLPYQIDLGHEWRELTGLPFVFAVWMAQQSVDANFASGKLEAAKQRGMQQIDQIVRTHALPRGWPADVARRYLTENLKFDIDERELAAIRLFHQKCAQHQIIPTSRDLVL
jgi:chorismate dehydratase